MVMTAPDADTHERGSEFAALLRQIRAAGLLDRRRWNYALRIGLTLGFFAATWWAFAWVGDSWYATIVAAVMGFAFTQVAFLGHDGGHQQVARTKRVNDLLGLVTGNLLIGLSYGWWVSGHNAHHSNPNHEGDDPDIGDGVLAFTDLQARKRLTPVARFIAANQAWLFFPLLTLEGLNLHVQSVGWLRQAPTRRYRRTELFFLAVHTVALLTALLLVLSPVKAFAFLAIQEAVWGFYMGCSFAPNHKGMPIIPEGTRMDFLRKQVLTTRNVRGGVITDFMLGGLNYQVEHHLFPNMPRPNLRKAQPLIRSYCQQLDVAYTEVSLGASYAAALRYLHAVGKPLREAARVLAPSS
jgi:fatty acid desaturase